MSKKEEPQAAEQDRVRLINTQSVIRVDKSFDVPDTFPSCYGLYFSADSIMLCNECEHSRRCFQLSLGR